MATVAAAFALPSLAYAHSGDAVTSVPAAATPTIDGTISFGEWDAAAPKSFSMFDQAGGATPVTGTLRVVHTATTLYMAVRILDPAQPTGATLHVVFDNNHDGLRDAGDDYLMVETGNTFANQHDRYLPATGVDVGDALSGGSEDIQGAVTTGAGGATFELSHPLCSADTTHDFCLAPGQTIGFGLSYNTNLINRWPLLFSGSDPAHDADLTITNPLATLAGPGACGGTVINFDDVTTVFTPLGEHYASQGVHFLDDALRTPQSTQDFNRGGVPTHSPFTSLFNGSDVGTSANVPLVINFDQPQSRVGFYLGNGPGGVTATIRAYDSSNRLIGLNTFAFNSDPVTQFYGIAAPIAIISRVEIDYGSSILLEEMDDLCFDSTPVNDSWPHAQTLNFDGSSASASQDLAQQGQARWYTFPVLPNSQVTIDLSQLPDNYDFFVFKDIGAAFNELTSTDDLTQLSAEFAGDATAPSAFSPSAFSPSAFSPSAFSPSAFSSEAYASAQVRSLIGGSANEGTAPEHVTLNTWNNRRLYIRVNGRNGAFSPANQFQLNVTRDPSVCDGIDPIGSAPASQPSVAGLQTIILTDPSRWVNVGTNPEKSAMLSKLQTLASRPEVGGQIVDLSQDARVNALNAQADSHAACPYAKNLVAGAIKDIVDSYRPNNPGLKYVVIVGGDHVIPFFRYPDTAGLGPETDYFPPVLDASASQASLRRDYVLSQDAYGAKKQISLRDSTFPIPNLAVGRLVETPTEISGMLDSYMQTTAGVVPTPTTSLVTGYDFLADAAKQVQTDLTAGLGSQKDTLITDSNVLPTTVGDPPSASWDADRLRAKLFGSRHDLIFLAGHFSANDALAADFTTTITSTELAASLVNMVNSIVWSAGCHSGYNIVDPDAIPNVTATLDWAEAFAQKRATLIAGTGYQYGDTDFIEYSERLYANFTHQLLLGSGAVTLGQALVGAKQNYLETTPQLGGMHQKALLEATLFGLPMLAVNLPAGRIPQPTTTSIVTSTTPFTQNPGSTLGLTFANVSLGGTGTESIATTPHSQPLANLTGGARYLSGPDGIVTNPGQPALPLARKDVTVSGYVLRGVGLRSASFTDTSPWTPLTGAAATELGVTHGPFPSSTFFPSRLWSVNYFNALTASGGATSLLVTPAQYRADAPGSLTDIERRYTDLGLRLYYSKSFQAFGPNTPALAAPPSIVHIETTTAANTVSFAARVVGDPAAGIQEVWVTYSGVHPGVWESLDLTQSPTDSTLWTGTTPALPAGVQAQDMRYLVQAVNGVGLVSLDDNFGGYYVPGAEPGVVSTTPPTPTAMAFVSAPASGVNGTTVPVSANLSAGGTPLAGKPVIFTIGGSSAVGITNANGTATAAVALNDPPGIHYHVTAAFAGDLTYAPKSVTTTTDFTILPRPTSLTLSPLNSSISLTAAAGPVATLMSSTSPLPQKTVLFVLRRQSDASVAALAARLTDGSGKASLGYIVAPVGTYNLDVYFGGTVGSVSLGDPTPYTAEVAHGTITISYAFSGFYQPVDNLPEFNGAKAGSGIPIKFSLGSNVGLSIFAPGYPKVLAISCPASASVDTVETTVTASSNSLNYDSTSNQYVYTWKTSSAWSGTCQQFVARFPNGDEHSAYFKFTK